MRQAASILICHYASLNMAIDMGFAGRNQIASDANLEQTFVAKKGQVTQLKELVGGALLNQAPSDVAIRVHLVNMLVQLMLAEEIESNDIEELLDDFMEKHFSVLADETSHREIATKLYKVRRELTFCAVNDFEMIRGSAMLNSLLDFNRANQQNVAAMSDYMKKKKAENDEVGSDSSGFESYYSDGRCEEVNSDEEQDDMLTDSDEEEKKKRTKKPVKDVDEFEEVTTTRRRR